ncbi:hypothetical protein MHU86_6785 [Fragilaria crotonensis]|nr:hypothetical protein MHU86_6785 [Fragilaria crotonensis]
MRSWRGIKRKLQVNRHNEGRLLKSISTPETHLQDAMASLSLDYWTAPKESLCAFHIPSLSVNFLCMDQVADEKERKRRKNINQACRSFPGNLCGSHGMARVALLLFQVFT